MLTDQGKFTVIFLLMLAGLFASGYFLGWSREKLSSKIFDKMLHYLDRMNYYRGRYDEVTENYYDLMDKNKRLREYTIEVVGIEHVPQEFGGELPEEEDE